MPPALSGYGARQLEDRQDERADQHADDDAHDQQHDRLGQLGERLESLGELSEAEQQYQALNGLLKAREASVGPMVEALAEARIVAHGEPLVAEAEDDQHDREEEQRCQCWIPVQHALQALQQRRLLALVLTDLALDRQRCLLGLLAYGVRCQVPQFRQSELLLLHDLSQVAAEHRLQAEIRPVLF